MITFCSHVWWILRAHEELFANGVLNNLADFCLPYGELDVCLVHNTVIRNHPLDDHGDSVCIIYLSYSVSSF